VNVAYKLGANSFMVKPMDFEDVVHMSQFPFAILAEIEQSSYTFRSRDIEHPNLKISRNEAGRKTQLNALKRGSRRSRRAGKADVTRQEIRPLPP